MVLYQIHGREYAEKKKHGRLLRLVVAKWLSKQMPKKGSQALDNNDVRIRHNGFASLDKRAAFGDL